MEDQFGREQTFHREGLLLAVEAGDVGAIDHDCPQFSWTRDAAGFFLLSPLPLLLLLFLTTVLLLLFLVILLIFFRLIVPLPFRLLLGAVHPEGVGSVVGPASAVAEQLHPGSARGGGCWGACEGGGGDFRDAASFPDVLLDHLLQISSAGSTRVEVFLLLEADVADENNLLLFTGFEPASLSSYGFIFVLHAWWFLDDLLGVSRKLECKDFYPISDILNWICSSLH